MGTIKTFKRRATFTVTTVNRRRVFTPVNKRAQAFSKIAGRTRLTSADLKAIKALGFRVAETGTLETIKV